MMTARTFILTDARVRLLAADAVLGAPDGVACVIRPARRNLEQNALLHTLFADIARQVEFFGQKRDAETVKRLLVDAFARVKKAMGEPIQPDGQMLPSLDRQGVVQLGVQTRTFSKALMGEFIEYLYAWGADNDVRWSEPVEVPGWYQDKLQNEQGMAA